MLTRVDKKRVKKTRMTTFLEVGSVIRNDSRHKSTRFWINTAVENVKDASWNLYSTSTLATYLYACMFSIKLTSQICRLQFKTDISLDYFYLHIFIFYNIAIIRFPDFLMNIFQP